MKTLINTLLLIFISISCSLGQDSDKREVGIRMNSLNSFDLLFKKKIFENTYGRLRLANANINLSGGENQNTRFSMSGSVALGLEKRKVLTDEFNFIYGIEGILGGIFNRSRETNTGSYRAGLGLVIGWNYRLSNNITLGVETIPTLTYSRNYGSVNSTHNIDAGFNTGGVSLTATYRY